MVRATKTDRAREKILVRDETIMIKAAKEEMFRAKLMGGWPQLPELREVVARITTPMENKRSEARVWAT